MRRAYLLYSACLQGLYSEPDAAYWLNRAAVCLKVKAYVELSSVETVGMGLPIQACKLIVLFWQVQAC